MTEHHQRGWSGYLRPLVRNGHFKMVTTLSTVKEWAGSNASIASITGSMQSLLDPSKMMSMQEDARSHKISAEIMKHSLYKSVTGPNRRRMRSRMTNSQTWSDDPNSLNQSSTSSLGWYPRYYMSLPHTPADSGRTSPVSSPTRKFPMRFLSRGTTPRCSSPTQIVEEDEESQGLASIFKPRPRFIRANQKSQTDLNQMDDDNHDEDDEDGNDNTFEDGGGGGKR